MLIFMGKQGEAFRLTAFGGVQLAASILLVITLIVHLVVNIKPLFIALGVADRRFIKDLMIVLAIVLLACAVGFVIYFLRWNVLWRYGG